VSAARGAAAGLAFVVIVGCGSVGGRLGGRGGGGGGGSATLENVVVSEIMYHPVLEEGYEDARDRHEWLEVANTGEDPADLTGWSFTAGIDFVFPELELAPGDAVVVAASRIDFEAVHDVDPALVVGEFTGRLANGGELIELRDADGDVVDAVLYDDAAPWPMGADGLGVGDAWLPVADQPEEAHRYRGRSLVRVVHREDPSDPGVWEASSLDGETPGRLRPSGRTVSIPTVTGLALDGFGDQPLPPSEPIVMRFRTSVSNLESVRVEWFVDDLRTESEILESVFAVADGYDWVAELPGVPAESILRYRLVAIGIDGEDVIAPREGDPMRWYGAFVGEPIGGNTRAYRVYISPANLVRMSENIAEGRVIGGCTPNPTWNDREAAVFVWGSEVYDVRVRFQGSRFQRRNGPVLSWTEPTQLPIRSWRIAFPRYAPFDGRQVLTLNKLLQACPGIEARVGFQLYDEAGIPAPRTRYVRLFINGMYYNYTLEIERPGEDVYTRWHAQLEAADPDRPDEPGVGDLFKAVGCNCDEGPWGWGDERLLTAHCGYTVDERYAATYDRKTWQDWGTADMIRDLIEGLHAARAVGLDELRAYLEGNYDVDRVLTHIAVTNWTGPWDDMLHNHYLYRRRSDGRWSTAPWDLDLTFGAQRGPTSTLYTGLQGVGSQWWNRTKDSFLQVYLPEYEARLLELNNTILHPDNVLAKLDGAVAEYDLAEISEMPSGPACNYTAREAAFREFVTARHAFVNDELGP